MGNCCTITPMLYDYIDPLNGKILGKGAFGKVIYAKGKDGSEAAIKILKNPSNIKLIKNEIKLQKLCSHKNCIKLLGSAIEYKYQNQTISYIILELANGGPLFTIITMYGPLDEDVARLYAKELYTVIGYFHERGISHRDLKPENILLDSNYTLKIADFGLATKLTDKNMSSKVGSPGYMAPEVYKGDYHHENDIWAACVIHFILMNGRPPFSQPLATDQWFRDLVQKKWDHWWKAHQKFSNVTFSQDIRDFFQKVFILDPKNRPSIKNMLAHKWFLGKTCSQNEAKARIESMMDENINVTGYSEEPQEGAQPPPNTVLPRSTISHNDEAINGTILAHKFLTESLDSIGDQKEEEEDAEMYFPTVISHTKFKSISRASQLYKALKKICESKNIKYTPDGKYAMECTIPGENKLIFKIQVFQMEDSAHRIVDLTRLQGTIRSFMGIYANFRMQMRNFISIT